MTLEVTTASETAPLEVLDVQVSSRRSTSTGPLSLSIGLLYRTGRANRSFSVPTLSWFDASRLQDFSQQLAVAQYPESCSIDLPDAGLRLTGSVRRLAGRWTTGRTVKIEPLPGAAMAFAPFLVHASHTDIANYSRKLYNRLWEVFTRG